jgi:hypothetical protein
MFSARRRLSGSGTALPAFDANAFVLAKPLADSAAKVTSPPGRRGLTVTVEAEWDRARPQSGEFDIGTLILQIPSDMALGSTFIIAGAGTVLPARGGPAIPLNVIPIAVRIWGGPEPTGVTIEGPAQVTEEAEATFIIRTQGRRAGADNVGWWVEPYSGRASVQADPHDPWRATLHARRAGWVALHVVVGRKTEHRLVRVLPKVDVNWNLVGMFASRITNIRRLRLKRFAPVRE